VFQLLINTEATMLDLLGKYEGRPQDAVWLMDVAADVLKVLALIGGLWFVVSAVFSLVPV
jgi:hypothetical protein